MTLITRRCLPPNSHRVEFIFKIIFSFNVKDCGMFAVYSSDQKSYTSHLINNAIFKCFITYCREEMFRKQDQPKSKFYNNTECG